MACHSRHALRDVDGEPLGVPRLPSGFGFSDPEWQVSHRLLAALQGRGMVVDRPAVRVVCALVEAWPVAGEPSEAK